MRKYRVLLAVVTLFFFESCSEGEKGVVKGKIVPTTKKTLAKPMQAGQMVYLQFCLACHMANGEGVPGLYPTLVQTEGVLGDKNILIGTVLHGMEGPIKVNGQDFNNVMAKLDYLPDKDIAEVLNYVRTNFGNKGTTITELDVKAVRSGGIN
jgi:mono/diheme cytochrome c family protein